MKGLYGHLWVDILKRMNVFIEIPIESMDENAIRQEIKKIGEIPV